MAAATETSTIVIRDIDGATEMRAVEELQKEVWRIPDLDVVPLSHLVAAKAAGGVLLGAFDRETLIGFVYGFVSHERGTVSHHSHMLAVKPAYRNSKLGYRLKLAQRERVLAQGITVMTWTFDPLQSLNAHFNFNKLGVVADRYLPDFYGDDAASFLHQTGTDRLWVSWFVSESGSPLVFESNDSITIEIPRDINSLQQQQPEAAMKWREETRRAFMEAIKAGYVVVGFTHGRYLLRKENPEIP